MKELEDLKIKAQLVDFPAKGSWGDLDFLGKDFSKNSLVNFLREEGEEVEVLKFKYSDSGMYQFRVRVGEELIFVRMATTKEEKRRLKAMSDILQSADDQGEDNHPLQEIVKYNGTFLATKYNDHTCKLSDLDYAVMPLQSTAECLASLHSLKPSKAQISTLRAYQEGYDAIHYIYGEEAAQVFASLYISPLKNISERFEEVVSLNGFVYDSIFFKREGADYHCKILNLDSCEKGYAIVDFAFSFLDIREELNSIDLVKKYLDFYNKEAKHKITLEEVKEFKKDLINLYMARNFALALIGESEGLYYFLRACESNRFNPDLIKKSCKMLNKCLDF